MAKPKPPKQRGPREVGWRFWLACFAVLAGPSTYISWGLFKTDVTRTAPVTFGAIGAMIGAGLLSWAANGLVRVTLARSKRANRKKKKHRGHAP